MTKTKSTYLALLAVLLSPMPANAVPLIDFGSATDSFVWFGNTLGCGLGCTLGYQFELSGSVTIDGLGVFDDLMDGLNNTHDVGIWTTGGVLVASTSVLAGTVGTDASASGLGGFAYADIAALTLDIGSYVIGALYSVGHTDRVIFEAGGIFSSDPNAAFIQAAFVNNAAFQMPNVVPSFDRYFGPTLRVAQVSVPEPGTLALLGIGLFGMGLARRKKV